MPDLHTDLYKAVRFIGRPFILLFLCVQPCFAQTISSSAEALVDPHQLVSLEVAITTYELLQQQGGWPVIPAGPNLVAGTRHPTVRSLRNRLRVTGEFAADVGADPQLFDDLLAAALKRYQARLGLAPSGKLDVQTRGQLNVTVAQRLQQLRHARARWLAQSVAAGRRIWVNIPEASVAAIADGTVVLQMKAIVGHPSRPTPELSSQLSRIVVNPTWTVPRSIAVADILPKQQQDNSYLIRNRIRVFDGWSASATELDAADVLWATLSEKQFPYRLRQDAGPFNALGKYKFDFPNDYDVYLHDTPSRNLMELDYRTLSSGCVRVEEPVRLADWLVADYTADALAQARTAAQDDTVSLRVADRPRIDLVYITAWVGTDGAVNFRPDIYGLVPATDS